MKELEQVVPCSGAETYWAELVSGRRAALHGFLEDGALYVVLAADQHASKKPWLTARQHGVLLARARGCPNKCVAIDLGLSPSTVSGIVRDALRRLGLRSVWEYALLCSGEPRADVH